MRLGAKLLESQPSLIERTGCGGFDVFSEDGECFPQREGLESQDDLHVGLLCHLADKLEVAPQKSLLQYVNRFVHNDGGRGVRTCAAGC